MRGNVIILPIYRWENQGSERLGKVGQSHTTNQGWSLALTWACGSLEATQLINHCTWGTDHCLPGTFTLESFLETSCWLQASLLTTVPAASASWHWLYLLTSVWASAPAGLELLCSVHTLQTPVWPEGLWHWLPFTLLLLWNLPLRPTRTMGTSRMLVPKANISLRSHELLPPATILF